MLLDSGKAVGSIENRNQNKKNAWQPKKVFIASKNTLQGGRPVIPARITRFRL
jgi:hypothetical protein